MSKIVAIGSWGLGDEGGLPPPPTIPAERESLPTTSTLATWGIILGVCGYIFWSTTATIGKRRTA